MTSGEKADAPAPAPDKPPVSVRDAWEHVLSGDGKAGKVLTVTLVLILGVGSAFLLMPPRVHPVVPYDESDLGHFANGVIKADRDYTIPDEATTDRKRAEARATVKPVYDFESGAADDTVERVHEAFNLMQRAYGDWRLERARHLAAASAGAGAAAPGSGEAAAPGTGQAAPPKPGAAPAETKATPDVAATAALKAAASASPETPAERKAVDAVLRSHKAEFLQLLQVVVDDAEFDALVRARFDPRIEAAVVTLVGEAMARPIIADRQLLSADRKTGIVIRPVPVTNARAERTIDHVDTAVTDLASARAGVLDHLPTLLSHASPEVRLMAGRLARRLLRPTLTFNREVTSKRQDEAAASVKPVVIQVARGEKIIGDGERIERRHLVIFQWMRKEAASIDSVEMYVGAGLIGVLLVLSLVAFARGSVWRFRPNRKDLLFLLTVLLGTLALARVGLFMANVVGDRFTGVGEATLYYALPVAAAVVMVRLVLSGEVSLVFAAVLSFFVAVLADGNLGFGIYVFVGGMVGADIAGRARDRGGIWRAGLVMAVVNALLVVALNLKHGGIAPDDYLAGVLSGAFAGAVTPLIVLGLTFVVEKIFGYTTDLTLLELANLNNPLLKELVVAAPGTYHHSMMLGSMVEAAAEAIGGNPLLARVGAYYHDIGKGKAPLYFAENQKGENPHDKLAPSMSALIIRRHVTDGIRMGRASRLPDPILDMIPMHHGTRLMSYFWHKAKEEAERKGEPVPAETEYRHLGPKPRFREAALLMIADSVEAASRTLTEPNADRFRGVVQKVINACFADGQFDEVDITLKDLHAVTRSFVRSLEAIYHSRPEYQQPADKSDKSAAKAKPKDKGNGAGKAAAPAGPASDDAPNEGADAPPEAAAEAAPVETADPVDPAGAEAALSAQPTGPDGEPGEEGGEALKRLGTN